ncbi:MAG: hypothetical protein PHG03_04810 [Bacilli bacterium]|nr:hypothetical protein [Bacilli bacterium]
MKTKSIWGNPPTRLYKLISLAEQNWGKKYKACIVGCSDGKFLMPFARRGTTVVGYDIDDTALYGGIKAFPIIDKKVKYDYKPDFISKKYELEDKKVLGTIDRIKLEKVENFAKVEKRDFYRDVPNEKYDVVFTSCSLHYSANQDFTLQEKTHKLQNIVSEDGYLYMDYMMAIDEDDYEKYPSSKFYRKNEILDFFDSDWEIISFRENHNPTFEGAHVDCVYDHFHRFGYLLAKRIGKND